MQRQINVALTLGSNEFRRFQQAIEYIIQEEQALIDDAHARDRLAVWNAMEAMLNDVAAQAARQYPAENWKASKLLRV